VDFGNCQPDSFRFARQRRRAILRPINNGGFAMTLKPTTPATQEAALDVLIRTALTNSSEHPMSDDLRRMMESLQPDAGQRVADILVMLAGAAEQDRDAWIALLQKHIDGAEDSDDENPEYRWQVAVQPEDHEVDAMDAWLDGEAGEATWVEAENRVLFAIRADADHFVSVWGGKVERL
jgi:hypothetical protein